MTAPAPRPQRRPVLTPVPTQAEQRAFERFLAGWLAEAAERRIRTAWPDDLIGWFAA